MSTCSSCGARVIWAHHQKTGNPAPIDAEPVPDGNVWLATDGTYYIPSKAEREREDFAGELRKSHFVTCVNAAKHRKARA